MKQTRNPIPFSMQTKKEKTPPNMKATKLFPEDRYYSTETKHSIPYAPNSQKQLDWNGYSTILKFK